MIARLEALPRSARLSLAWLLCLLPRAAGVAALGGVGDYRVFGEPGTQPQSFWYPLYEGLARGLWALSGSRLELHIACHLVIGAALGPFVYAACGRLGLSKTAAWLSVLSVAFHPYLASTGARQPQLAVTITFVAAIVWLFARWSATHWRPAEGAALGLLGALAWLLRPNFLFSLAALYALAALRARLCERAALSRIAASASLCGLALLVIAGGSRLANGSWSPLPPVLGHNLYVGHHEHTGEYLRRYDVESAEDSVRDHGYPAPIAAIADPRARDAALWRAGVDFALGHPQQTAVNTALKLGRYWDPRLEDAERTPLWWNLLYTGPYLVYAGLAVWGALVLYRRRTVWPLAVIGTVLVSYWLPHAVLFPTVRMRMTTEFLLVMLAAAAVASGFESRDLRDLRDLLARPTRDAQRGSRG